ncbi:MAG: cysteine hydrolase family protein [Kineosporiaceae bacterium]
MTAGRRALVVIDVQREYDPGVFPGAGLPITHPPLGTSTRNIARAMDAARAAGVPVVVVQHTDPPDEPVFAEGSEGWRLQPFVEDRPHDHLVRKQYPGSFTGTDLEDRLRADGVDTVTVVGYMTQLCVDTTARQAAHRGFTVEVLEDATGTLPLAVRGEQVSAPSLHAAVLAGLGSAFASVASTDEWVDAVEAGTPLPPPSLLDAVARGAAQ